jgi:hypothetical protein
MEISRLAPSLDIIDYFIGVYILYVLKVRAKCPGEGQKPGHGGLILQTKFLKVSRFLSRFLKKSVDFVEYFDVPAGMHNT